MLQDLDKAKLSPKGGVSGHAPTRGLTLDEVAQQLGVSRQTVIKVEARALEKAKVIVEQHGYKLSDLF